MHPTLTHLRAGFTSSLAAWLWLGGVGLVGCSENRPPEPATYAQLLTSTTSKTWRLASLLVINDGGQPTNVPLGGCDADDQYVFYAGDVRRFQVTEGATKCSPADPDVVVESNWSLVNANASLTFVLPLLAGSPYPFTIKSLTATTLTVEAYQDDNTSIRCLFNAVR